MASHGYFTHAVVLRVASGSDDVVVSVHPSDYDAEKTIRRVYDNDPAYVVREIAAAPARWTVAGLRIDTANAS